MSSALQIANQLKFIVENIKMPELSGGKALNGAFVARTSREVIQILERENAPLALIQVAEGSPSEESEFEFIRNFQIGFVGISEDDRSESSILGRSEVSDNSHDLGILHIEKQFLKEIDKLNATNGIEANLVLSGIEATEEIPEVGEVSFINYLVEARCTRDNTFEPIPRLRLSVSGSDVTAKWTNVAARYDRVIPKMVYKIGSAPASSSDGTVVSITDFLPATKTFTPGSGVVYVAMFSVYNNGLGGSDVEGEQVTRKITVP